MRVVPFVAAVLAGWLAITPALATHPGDTILLAGDSTVSDYKADRYPQTGWGTMLRCAIGPDMRVLNHAMGGRSTRTFLAEGRWDRLRADIQPGDTVLIQFGHNDAYRLKPERWAPAQTDYRDNLLRFVWDVRTAGGVPVLVTPVARRNFGADGHVQADFAQWSAVMRDVAVATHTPLIDLEAKSRALLDRVGPVRSRPWYLHYTPADQVAAYPKGIDDDTHFSEVGARQMANLVAEGLKSLGLPVSARVTPNSTALTRTTPLGRTDCQ